MNSFMPLDSFTSMFVLIATNTLGPFQRISKIIPIANGKHNVIPKHLMCHMMVALLCIIVHIKAAKDGIIPLLNH